MLDMGRPVKILDLARDVIRFYGLEPDVDIPIVYTGIRPGEKLFVELLTSEEGTERTPYERLLVARLQEPPAGWRDQLDTLVRAAHAEDEGQVRAVLADLVPTLALGVSLVPSARACGGSALPQAGPAASVRAASLALGVSLVPGASSPLIYPVLLEMPPVESKLRVNTTEAADGLRSVSEERL